MRVLLLDDIKITKLELPLEISGSFLLKQKSLDSNVEREMSIEAINGKWVLHASTSIGIVDSKNSYLDDVVLGMPEKRALYNAVTGVKYSPKDLLINTDIRNGTRLVLM